ncbi:hypothetical protein [Treponema endosymbiont of Eucomonympha sp.]|uniref:hypothetical protein n=1 Tax=Treponema endosymbiont of Eucomonympha sp. TaxID=1580831 RepID=UPI000AEA5608|nr:hypothetical protein [Treponema endosymbiont of Eucomonympha sp.]
MLKGASLYAVVRVSGYRVYQEGLPKVSTSKATEQYADDFLYLITRLTAYPYPIMRADCGATYAAIPAIGFALRPAISHYAPCGVPISCRAAFGGSRTA